MSRAIFSCRPVPIPGSAEGPGPRAGSSGQLNLVLERGHSDTPEGVGVVRGTVRPLGQVVYRLHSQGNSAGN